MSPELTRAAPLLSVLLTTAWLAPLVGFAAGLAGLRWSHRLSRKPAWLAIGCISTSLVCSLAALVIWVQLAPVSGTAHLSEQAAGHTTGTPVSGAPPVVTGVYYTLATFGDLTFDLTYAIDGVTCLMCVVVCLVACCVQVYALGYLQDELTEDYIDHAVLLPTGEPVRRPGRLHHFYALLSLFCFAMLGIVLAGNLLQVFVFWELVGLTSYLLIGFYVERPEANAAALKAFVMNRVGDVGFLVAIMIFVTACGTLNLWPTVNGQGLVQPGLMTQLRHQAGVLERTADGQQIRLHTVQSELVTESGRVSTPAPPEERTMPYSWLVLAGLGLLAGCLGKSAQFPLQTWLPSAMAGPTPVSALVHSATMVAAGIYLAARCAPLFAPEVLLVAAYIGVFGLTIAACSALVAHDIKQVLAYSTASQMGYMLLAVGVGAEGAGLFHLVTHACFKALLFLGAGCVIVACHHTKDIRQLGGLGRKMPWTAGMMLVGTLALTGVIIPGLTIWGEPLALSGYHSKEVILASALAFAQLNPGHSLLFIAPVLVAGLSTVYLFRLWLLVFTGEPRNLQVFEPAREAPAIMLIPVLVLAIAAALVGLGGHAGGVRGLIAANIPVLQDAPAATQTVVFNEVVPGAAVAAPTKPLPRVRYERPSEVVLAEAELRASRFGMAATWIGLGLAWLLYVVRWIDTSEIRRSARGLVDLARCGWRFDEVYQLAMVEPVCKLGRWLQWLDQRVFDEVLHRAAALTVLLARGDRWFDERVVDGVIENMGRTVWFSGLQFRRLQTGWLRQYVMWIAVAVTTLYVVLLATLP